MDCINWYVASTGVESCLRKHYHVIEKFHAKPKILGFKVYVGLIKQHKCVVNPPSRISHFKWLACKLNTCY